MRHLTGRFKCNSPQTHILSRMMRRKVFYCGNKEDVIMGAFLNKALVVEI